MKNDKILILSDAGDPANLELAGEIAALGWRVILVSHRRPAGPMPQGVRFQRIHLPVFYPLTYVAFCEFALILFRRRPDIIHAFHLSDYGVLAALSQRFLRQRFTIVSATGSDVQKDAFTRRGWSIKHILVLAPQVTCADKASRAAALRLGTPEARISVIPNVAGSCMEYDRIYRKLLAGSGTG